MKTICSDFHLLETMLVASCYRELIKIIGFGMKVVTVKVRVSKLIIRIRISIIRISTHLNLLVGLGMIFLDSKDKDIQNPIIFTTVLALQNNSYKTGIRMCK